MSDNDPFSKDRYVNRRKMAWWSFYLLSFTGVSLVIFGLFSDGHAQRIETLSFLIGTVTGLWVSIILAYFGSSVVTDRQEIKELGKKPIVQVETDHINIDAK
jgi:hypothetical protein